MRYLVLAIAALGCSSRVNGEYCQNHGTDHAYCPWLDAATAPDAQPLCLGAGGLALCVDTPAAPVALPADLDTDLSTLCLPAPQPAMWKTAGQADACFIVGTSVMIDMVRAHGGRPLVVIASDTITVTNLDVSSSRAGSVGAGYDPSVCAAFGGLPGAGTQGAGGGAGGTFYSNTGGAGGMGNNGQAAAGMPGTAVTMPTLLRGGCPGQNGGNGSGSAGGGNGATGGGALYLVAGTQIDLTNATLNASGAGGNAATVNNAGGGGYPCIV